MVENYRQITEQLVERVSKTIEDEYNPTALGIVISAYNRYRADECNYKHYLYNINEKEDLKEILDNYVTIDSFVNTYNEIMENEYTSWVSIDYRETTSNKLITYEFDDIIETLKANAENIIECVLKYVARCKEYQNFYEYYITQQLETIPILNMN